LEKSKKDGDNCKMVSSMPAVSVIISNFNGFKYLPKLVETLKAQKGVHVELIIVDRNSSDKSDLFFAQHTEIKVVKEPAETGLVSGYHAGSLHATNSLLFFCNEDMWFEPDCLMRLTNAIDLSKGIFASDPWQWTYDGKTWIHGGTRFRRCFLNMTSLYPFRKYNFTSDLKNLEQTPFGCAGAVMIHKEKYDSLGGWDTTFFLDHEDVDFFLRGWREGLICVSVPEAKVYHAVNVSNNKSIGGGRTLVGKRRYISGKSSLLVMAVKHCAFWHSALLFFIFFSLLMSQIISLNFKRFWWSILAGLEFLKRFNRALSYRRNLGRQVKWAHQFFSEKKFQEKILS
jgi:GT2 family glycosyltransferase